MEEEKEEKEMEGAHTKDLNTKEHLCLSCVL